MGVGHRETGLWGNLCEMERWEDAVCGQRGLLLFLHRLSLDFLPEDVQRVP
jgi:hypothetical protein